MAPEHGVSCPRQWPYVPNGQRERDLQFLSLVQHQGVSTFTTFEAASLWWAMQGVMEQTVIANQKDVIVVNLVMELGDFSVHRSNLLLAVNVRGT